MGWGEAFAYHNAAAIFREHAALSGFENRGTRAFDISAWSELSQTDYETLPPTQWPLRRNGTGAISGSDHVFSEGRFAFPSGRARIVAIPAGKLATPVTARYPFILNSGRVRDQWHSMTRTGLSPRLAAHVSEPFVEINAEDARRLGLDQGRLARVRTRHGEAVLRVMLSERVQLGSLFVPIQWTAENRSAGRIGGLVGAAT